ncbi:MAG: hypothetical protein J0M35_01940 [Candidatus Obscuribacter phosphatis]|uniref:ATP-binding protein n=1 Tax=Candidatus Obscuribacter phosphatis TaxID=1906157 RepID=A0A8J7TK54_9BACT|nr:hypothetical protein [Candidatus Obscuribacter phosphatis]
MTTEETSDSKIEVPPNQFRMRRLQVLNWGTFSQLHDMPIAEKGFLITGPSGAGKSTLLDAIAALLVPPKWHDFNAAAREGDRARKNDRNLLSYLRGAYAEQKDSESGEYVVRYLRENTTRSALALSYRNALGRTVTIAQFLYIKGTSNNPQDVKRLYMIFEREFDLKELDGIDIDIRKIKHAFDGQAHINDEFRPHAERFRRLLGIEHEMALRLLQKTQSAKNLGDLNLFLREFMLDPPDTFEVADRLVKEFGELDQAHQSVITARLQIETLKPARELFEERKTLNEQYLALSRLQQDLEAFTEQLRCKLFSERIAELSLKVQQTRAVIEQKESAKLAEREKLSVLEQLHQEKGGGLIERLKNDRVQAEHSKTEKILKLGQVQQACGALGWETPASAESFVAMVTEARGLLSDLQSRGDVMLQKLLDARTLKRALEERLTECRREVESLRRQPSNIPSHMLRLRKQICTAISVHEDSLPFVGELLEVRAEETEWRGAIERVLHGFALSVLVEDRHYNALTNYVNSTNLGMRLVYYKTSSTTSRTDRTAPLNSLVSKLTFKGHACSPWLKSDLIERFNFDCVSSPQALRASERPAVTIEGLIKSSKARHEKDDRRDINDKRFWVLGFDNRAKLAIFEREEQELTAQLKAKNNEIESIESENKKLSADGLRWQTLANLSWKDIDATPSIDRIRDLNEQIRQLESTNSNLQSLGEQMENKRKKVREIEDDIAELNGEEREHKRALDKCKNDLSEKFEQWGQAEIASEHREELKRRFDWEANTVGLNNLDKTGHRVDKLIEEELKELTASMEQQKQKIETTFATFKREWSTESANMDETLASAGDYFQLLVRLENDNLPKYEDKFFDLLHNQSNQNLAALNTHITNGRKMIYERMEMVNFSLSRAPFNPETFLRIHTQDRNLEQVREFRQEISNALSHAWSSGDREQAESRFNVLRKLVKRLSSQETEDKNWKKMVLDVREHVEFVGLEIDADGCEIESYRSGAGKSGGQRQKLATTCLAAALNYQLSRDEELKPTYAAIVLDEAFDKADNEFTAAAMNIFKEFGFQMIVATPLKSVMTLEPFIGGAAFVDIRDRRVSMQLPLEYDNIGKRLKLTEEMRRDVESAIATS